MRSWAIFSALLISIGVATFLYKVVVLGYPTSTAETQDTWRVELVVNASGKGRRVVINSLLPRTSGYHRLIREEVRSGPLRFSIGENGDQRIGRWSGSLSESTRVSYQVTINTIEYRRGLPKEEVRDSYPAAIQPYLEASPGIDSDAQEITELNDELRLDPREKVALVEEIYGFVSNEIGRLRTAGEMDAISVIREGRANPLGRARLFCALARSNRLPCRVVPGFELVEGTLDTLHYWNEVFIGDAWVPFDAVSRLSQSITSSRVALSGEGPRAVEAKGTSNVSFRFEVESGLETYVGLMKRRLAESGNAVDSLSLLFLPVDLQRSLRVLLLVPLGALAMSVIRSMVGLKTFGMFMPMLIALALTATGPFWGQFFSP